MKIKHLIALNDLGILNSSFAAKWRPDAASERGYSIPDLLGEYRKRRLFSILSGILLLASLKYFVRMYPGFSPTNTAYECVLFAIIGFILLVFAINTSAWISTGRLLQAYLWDMQMLGYELFPVSGPDIHILRVLLMRTDDVRNRASDSLKRRTLSDTPAERLASVSNLLFRFSLIDRNGPKHPESESIHAAHA